MKSALGAVDPPVYHDDVVDSLEALVRLRNDVVDLMARSHDDDPAQWPSRVTIRKILGHKQRVLLAVIKKMQEYHSIEGVAFRSDLHEVDWEFMEEHGAERGPHARAILMVHEDNADLPRELSGE